MAQATPDISGIPAHVTLTNAARSTSPKIPLPPPGGQGSPLARSEGQAPSLFYTARTRKAAVRPPGLDGGAIGEKNRLSVGRQIEELLRIRREAVASASD